MAGGWTIPAQLMRRIVSRAHDYAMIGPLGARDMAFFDWCGAHVDECSAMASAALLSADPNMSDERVLEFILAHGEDELMDPICALLERAHRKSLSGSEPSAALREAVDEVGCIGPVPDCPFYDTEPCVACSPGGELWAATFEMSPSPESITRYRIEGSCLRCDDAGRWVEMGVITSARPTSTIETLRRVGEDVLGLESPVRIERVEPDLMRGLLEGDAYSLAACLDILEAPDEACPAGLREALEEVRADRTIETLESLGGDQISGQMTRPQRDGDERG